MLWYVDTDSIGTVPAPTLNPTMWKEPDASTFRLRSKTYKQDNFKCNSATNLFKLVAVDVFEVPDCIQNIAMHPQNRVFQALQRDENIWVFVVNIMVPGPPFYNFVAYMTGDKVYRTYAFHLLRVLNVYIRHYWKKILHLVVLLSLFSLVMMTNSEKTDSNSFLR
jgi:hypothetical protein